MSPSQPLPERTSHTKLVDSNQNAAQSDKRSRRRLSEQPPGKRQRTLSYSLFPAPIDRARFLGDLTTTPKKTPQAAQPESRPDEAGKPSGAQDQPPSTSQVTDVSEQRVLPQTIEDASQKKRKRSPSPDVIPNPAGCSYGLDLDYFCYSSDSEEEADAKTQQAVPPTKLDAPVKSVVRSAMRSEQGPSKRVRFDASPEDTPSKLRTRPRATDPYTGRHFIGMGDAARVAAPASPAAAPATPTPAARVDVSTPQRSPGFIPNKQGTFQLDYDAFSDDSDSSGAPSPTAPAATSVSETETATTQTTTTRTEVQERYVADTFDSSLIVIHLTIDLCGVVFPRLLHVPLHAKRCLRLPQPELIRKLSPESVLRPKSTNPKHLVGSALLVVTQVL